MIRILLFGTTGQVGWELGRSLQPLGTVTAVSRREADFDDPESLRAFFARRPDVVVNAVAYTAVDRAETDPVAAMRVNADAVGVLADEARRCGALLVHYSTDYVFDGASSVPYTEADPTNPQSQYGRSKRAGESAIEASGADHLILRTSWVYASRGRNFVRTILRLAAEQETMRIVADQHGAPTSARLIADCTARIVEVATKARADDRFDSGLYHLTASGRTSWHGFASHIVSRARGRTAVPLAVHTIEAITSSAFPLPAPRPANSSLSTERAIAHFGLHLPAWTVGADLCLDELLAE